MPRFHIHIEGGSGPSGDASRQELEDDSAAMQNAAEAVTDLLRDELVAQIASVNVKVTVADDAGRHVGAITLKAIVERSAEDALN